ncbi:MAG: DUF4446 family protein [Armatimonadota bacterium]
MGTTALTIVFAVLGAAVIALGIMVYLLWREVGEMRIESGTARSVAEALRDGRDEDAVRELMEYLEGAHERMAGLAEHARATDETLERFRERAKSTLQRVGAVRFDASEEVSGGLSCALAVLDAHGNGFLVTTLYDLSHSRTFVRAVDDGKTDRELLPEEAEALDAALNPATGRPQRAETPEEPTQEPEPAEEPGHG